MTLVENLDNGNNIFTWVLSTPECGEFSSASVVVHYHAALEVIAEPDNFVMHADEVLEVADLLSNDFVDPSLDYEVEIISLPKLGIADLNGNGFRYTYTNKDSISDDYFVYQICDPVCTEICDRTTVKIQIIKPVSPSDCFFPNTITPNGDGLNDVLEVNCLDQYPENEIEVFNRWGRKIYDAKPYQNDFDGKYKNKDLPAGTYFYVLKLNDDENTKHQGFFNLVR